MTIPKMNVGIKLRLALLGSAVGLIGLLIVAVVLSLQHQANEARAQLAQVARRLGSFSRVLEWNDHDEVFNLQPVSSLEAL